MATVFYKIFVNKQLLLNTKKIYIYYIYIITRTEIVKIISSVYLKQINNKIYLFIFL